MISKTGNSPSEAPRAERNARLSSSPRKFLTAPESTLLPKGSEIDQRVFLISYTAGRRAVNKSGKVVGIHLRPQTLRRHAATYASRSGKPIEIVSKVILRHAKLSKTQRYLGTVSDVEAMRGLTISTVKEWEKGEEVCKQTFPRSDNRSC